MTEGGVFRLVRTVRCVRRARPPLSAPPTSPPQGGRLGSALRGPQNVDKIPPHPQPFQYLTRKSLSFYPRLPHPCHTPCTPAAGWLASVAVQAGGRPPGLVVTCGGIQGEAEAGVLRWQSVLRGRPSQPPDSPSPTGSAIWRDQRMDGETGLWRIVGSLAPVFVPDALNSLSYWPRPGRSGKATADACRMRTSSGKFRAARALRHPGAWHPCTTQPNFRRQSPRAALRTVLSLHHPGGSRAGAKAHAKHLRPWSQTHDFRHPRACPEDLPSSAPQPPVQWENRGAGRSSGQARG